VPLSVIHLVIGSKEFVQVIVVIMDVIRMDSFTDASVANDSAISSSLDPG